MRIVPIVVLSLAAPAAFAETQIVVRGNIDQQRLRESLASELATDVAITEKTCNAPCLSINVEGSAATVVYSPRSGGLRERTVALGDDPTQWPLVIALLATNLAHDDTNAVLADIPDPVDAQPASQSAPAIEAPPPIEIPPPIVMQPPSAVAMQVAPPEAEKPWMLFGIGFVPGLSTDFTQVGQVRHWLSLDLIAGVSGGSSLASIAGVADIERGTVHGVQLAGVVATSAQLDGIQAAGVAAVAGDLHGVQLAGTAAFARGGEGAQFAGVATVARGATIQAAGVATVARDVNLQLAGAAAAARDATFQSAGAVTVARDASVQLAGAVTVARVVNFQAAGAVSVARDANMQIAGAVNVAGHVSGLQLAPINVARRVDGVQVGVVNVGGSPDGFSFGLINIVPGGRYDVEGTVDTHRVGTALFRHGGNGWHNVYGIGGHPVDEQGPNDDIWMYGLGFGPSWRTESTRTDVEAIAWQVNHGARHSDDLSLLAQARISFAYGLGPIALVVGAAYNVYISNDQMSPFITERRIPGSTMPTTSEVTVERWPSGFVGIRL